MILQESAKPKYTFSWDRIVLCWVLIFCFLFLLAKFYHFSLKFNPNHNSYQISESSPLPYKYYYQCNFFQKKKLRMKTCLFKKTHLSHLSTCMPIWSPVLLFLISNLKSLHWLRFTQELFTKHLNRSYSFLKWNCSFPIEISGIYCYSGSQTITWRFKWCL